MSENLIKKKVAIISPSLKVGGIERALTVLANYFVTKGYEVVFISCLSGDKFYSLHNDVKLIEPDFKNTGRLQKISFYLKLLFFLRNKLKKINPDRVLVFGDWFSPIVLLALLNTNFPVYISDRTIPNYIFKFPIPQLKKWLYPKSAGFIAQTQSAKNHKITLFGSRLRIQVIPNALPEFSENFNNTLEKEKKIIYVGRFAWEKDPEIIIRAMTIISVKYPDWKLEMAGTGPLLNTMKTLVNQLNLESKIIFLGNLQNVAQLYSSASVLVLPSIVEGFPNTLIEAMSFGLPCICFKDIPHEDIITDKIDGIVVKQRTPIALANAINQLILERELRVEIGINARKSVERFAKDKVAEQVLKFMKIV